MTGSNAIGRCPNCEEYGPLGLYCTNCEDSGMIYDGIIIDDSDDDSDDSSTTPQQPPPDPGHTGDQDQQDPGEPSGDQHDSENRGDRGQAAETETRNSAFRDFLINVAEELGVQELDHWVNEIKIKLELVGIVRGVEIFMRIMDINPRLRHSFVQPIEEEHLRVLFNHSLREYVSIFGELRQDANIAEVYDSAL